METNNNFKWLVNDIYESLLVKLYSKDNLEDSQLFEVHSIISTTLDEININFANINDMTNFLTLGMVRFQSVERSRDFIDIPFRNLYKLYQFAANIEDDYQNDFSLSIEDLEAFTVLNNSEINQGYYIKTNLVNKCSDDLQKLIDTAKTYCSLGMNDKFNALSDINMINYQRIKSDTKEKAK